MEELIPNRNARLTFSFCPSPLPSAGLRHRNAGLSVVSRFSNVFVLFWALTLLAFTVLMAFWLVLVLLGLWPFFWLYVFAPAVFALLLFLAGLRT